VTSTNGDGAASGDGSAPGGVGDLVISIRGVHAQPSDLPGCFELRLDTTRGEITGYLHPCEGRAGCVIFLGGAAGGVDGPADSVYVRLAQALVEQGVTSLRLEYREPGEFTECVLDALAGCSFLKGIGGESAVLVGHSFGGAVAIKAGELSPLICFVVALSSQRFGTQDVERLGKPLLLVHGEDDDVLLPAASEDIFGRAVEPKRLILLPGNGHGLRESATDVYRILEQAITDAVGDGAPSAGSA
jgi:fermentation-respiration switch protein FrsA (DUF1100 family)